MERSRTASSVVPKAQVKLVAGPALCAFQFGRLALAVDTYDQGLATERAACSCFALPLSRMWLALAKLQHSLSCLGLTLTSSSCHLRTKA
jgi:hypothetical protein